ncbi:hypothetical protein ABKN59_007748 [Abortiporus biennis]
MEPLQEYVIRCVNPYFIACAQLRVRICVEMFQLSFCISCRALWDLVRTNSRNMISAIQQPGLIHNEDHAHLTLRQVFSTFMSSFALN